MPRKKPEANKSSATRGPARARRPGKPRAAKSKAAAAAGSGDSILNLAQAVSGRVTPEQVAERAYFRWIERGCPIGTAEEDWFLAEQELSVGH